MRRALLKKFALVLLAALFLNSLIFYGASSRSILNSTREDMLYILESADSLLEYGGDLNGQVARLELVTDRYDSRLTVIAADGSVAADTGAVAASLDNHLDREEVEAALKGGSGYAIRRSATLGRTMLYVAMRSAHSDNVLRLAVPYSGMREYLPLLFPAAMGSFMLALACSIAATERFVSSVTRPLRVISREMLKVRGDYRSLKFEPSPYPEINVIADTTMEMSRDVEEYLARIEKEKQIRQEFFSNASHELKTPITSIRVLADSLMGMEEVPVELYREFMADISDEIDRENQIIEDLLTLVKMDKSAESQMNIAQVNINRQLEMILKRLRPIAKRGNVELILESMREVTADVDEVKMSLAITNLVENAIKYNVDSGWVRVTLDADHKYFYIKVADSGIGIPEDALDHIFDRFFRVDKARSREVGGTGLGLAITKNVVQMHRGVIDVESVPGEGTTFAMRIPLTYIVRQEARP